MPDFRATYHALFLLCILLTSFNAQAGGLTVEMRLTWQGQPVELDTPYQFASGEEVTFETVRFYLSAMEVLQQGKAIMDQPAVPQLIDLEEPASLKFTLPCPEEPAPDQLRFRIGLDSTVNVSGAMGGDLDPTLGMYWAWQSGYINFKVEGSSPICPLRHNRFQYHLGGYRSPNTTVQQVHFPIAGEQHLVVEVALDELLDESELRSNGKIMSPGSEAADMSRQLAFIFKIAEK